MRILNERGARLGSAAVSGGIVLLLSAVPPEAHPRITTALSWQADIHPILERRCMSCHRDGGSAPMSFVEYEATRPWARAIREMVLERRMPPSAMRSGSGLYANGRTMSAAELELIAAWVDGGAPSGTEPSALVPAAPAPVVRREPSIDWSITIDGHAAASDESSLTRRVTFAVPAGSIGAWTIDAGGLPVRAAHVTFDDGRVFGSWTPDEPPVRYPDAAAVRIARPTTVHAEFALTMPVDGSAATEATPRLKLLTRADAERAVVTRRVQEPSTPMIAGRTLLAIRLEVQDRDGTADVVLARKNGDRVFLMAMAPPGLPDPISYRLRTPLTVAAGDAIHVNTASPFELVLEELEPAARPTRQALSGPTSSPRR